MVELDSQVLTSRLTIYNYSYSEKTKKGNFQNAKGRAQSCDFASKKLILRR